MLVGHQKGRDTRENVEHNFGMPNPEGYRKAIRLFRQAEKLGLPIVTLIDTPGANPSLPAEERGQAQAIAESIAAMLAVRTPTVAVVTGEGGSGGALAIAVADRLLMLEHSIFTVASPKQRHPFCGATRHKPGRRGFDEDHRAGSYEPARH